MSSAHKYVDGARILALRAPSRSDVVGYDWLKVLYNPAGLAYDYANNPVTTAPSYAQSAANTYWAKQRAAVNPFAAAMPARQQAAAALQAQLRQQQMANIAAMQAQLASMPTMTPTPTMPGMAPSTLSTTPSATAPIDDSSAASPDATSDYDLTSASPYSTIVGATLGDQALVIRVKNVGDLVKQKGGALGNFAFQVAPQTIANTVYSEMQKQLTQKFKDQGVDVDVTVTGNPPSGSRPKAEFLRGAAIGIGTVGIGWATWHWGLSRLFRRGSK